MSPTILGLSAGKNPKNDADINPSEYSASFVRGLVKNGKRDDFTQVYSAYISPEDINKLYDTISIGSQLKPPASKNEDDNPQSKYYDGGLLPIINNNKNKNINDETVSNKRQKTSLGGRRTKKHRKNKRKTKRRYSKRK